MPARIARGAAAWWEPARAAGLTAATIASLVVIGGRVSSAAVLLNGPTLKLRDAWQHSRTSHPSRHGDATEPARPTDTTATGESMDS